MKNINVGILGGGEVASHLITYLIEYPMFNIKKIGVKNLDKPRYFDSYGFYKTNDLDDIVTDKDIDVIIECLSGIEPAQSMIIKALDSNKDVISCNKELWNRKESQDMIDAAIRNQKTIWLNSIVCSRDGNDLVLPEDLTHKNIKNYPADMLYIPRNCEGLHTGMSITKDLFKVLINNDKFKVWCDKAPLLEKYQDKIRVVDENVVIIDNFLENREHQILQNLIENISDEQIQQYIQYKKMEEFKHYCEVFLNRTDYENAYNEGAVYKGIDLFQVKQAAPIPEDIAEEITGRIDYIFSGPFISKGFTEATFLPNFNGEKNIIKHMDKNDQLVSSYKAIYFVNKPNKGGVFTFEGKKGYVLDLKPNSLIIFRSSMKEYNYTISDVEEGRLYFLENTFWSDIYGTKTNS